MSVQQVDDILHRNIDEAKEILEKRNLDLIISCLEAFQLEWQEKEVLVALARLTFGKGKKASTLHSKPRERGFLVPSFSIYEILDAVNISRKNSGLEQIKYAKTFLPYISNLSEKGLIRKSKGLRKHHFSLVFDEELPRREYTNIFANARCSQHLLSILASIYYYLRTTRLETSQFCTTKEMVPIADSIESNKEFFEACKRAFKKLRPNGWIRIVPKTFSSLEVNEFRTALLDAMANLTPSLEVVCSIDISETALDMLRKMKSDITIIDTQKFDEHVRGRRFMCIGFEETPLCEVYVDKTFKRMDGSEERIGLYFENVQTDHLQLFNVLKKMGKKVQY